MPLFYATAHGVKHALSDDTIQNMLKKYTDQCRCTIEMPEKVHFHMMRKTRAMDLYHAGAPLPHIQQLLGHESITTTTGFYAFATLDVLTESLNKVSPDEGEKSWDDPVVLKEIYRL